MWRLFHFPDPFSALLIPPLPHPSRQQTEERREILALPRPKFRTRTRQRQWDPLFSPADLSRRLFSSSIRTSRCRSSRRGPGWEHDDDNEILSPLFFSANLSQRWEWDPNYSLFVETMERTETLCQSLNFSVFWVSIASNDLLPSHLIEGFCWFLDELHHFILIWELCWWFVLVTRQYFLIF